MRSSQAASRRVSLSAAASPVFVLEALDARRLLTAALPKLGDVLGYLADDFSTRAEAKLSRSLIRNKAYQLGAQQPNAAIVRTLGDTVLVRAVANSKGGKKLATQLEAIGALVTATYGYLLSAAVPVSSLAKLANLSGLNYADASYAPITRAGKTDDLGVQAMNADKGQKQYAVNGSGVRVGILSDSYNLLGGASAGVASGDLPTGGVTVVKEGPAGDGEDEGRGMAEIVHDVAPGSPISFYSAYYSEADFANGILTLAKPTANGGQGAKVVVDDIAYFTEPFFQDGVIAQAVNTAYSSYGASYFSAAGNDGTDSYESTFRPTASKTIAGAGTGVFQDFDASATENVYQQITIPAGGSITLAFQWDAPFASASTNAGGSAAPTNSVGLYLLNAAKTATVATATTSRVGGDAYQILTYTNSGASAATRYLAMKVTSGTAPGFVKYIDYGGYGPTIQFATNSGTAIGHAVAANGLGVGAAYYGDTPAFGKTPAVKESYSSSGGVPLLFAPDGTRYATPQARQQPAIVAPDGAATTFFGEQVLNSTGTANDGQYHFYGTSAAAPHAAAVAALMLQANPSLTNAQVYATLKGTALDMDASGFDYNTGYGLVQADAALAAVASSSISGRVFRDVNANGVFDGSDTGVSGQTVYLDSNNNGLADSGTSTIATTTATAIPDATATYNALSRVSSSITSGLTGRVTGLSVKVNVSHARTSDLGLTLITPAGTRIPLLTTLGGITSNKGTGLDLTLDDSSSSYVQLFSSTAILGGTYKPQSPLSAANNESAAGTWQLEARDFKSGTAGTINGWSLAVTSADPTTGTDSNGNYVFSALTPSAFFGTYRVRTGNLSGYTLGTPSAGGFDVTLASSSAIAGDNFAFVPTAAATIASLVLDDGTAQRSMIRSVTVLFNGTIPAANIAAGAFSLTQNSGPSIDTYAVGVASVTTPASGQTAVRLTFAGPAVVAGSVADGRYTLRIDGSKITNNLGVATDAAGTSIPGSIRTYDFARLFGDIDGDNGVSINDFNAFAPAFGLSSSSPSFVSGFDYDGDNGISINDFNQFSPRFGKAV